MENYYFKQIPYGYYVGDLYKGLIENSDGTKSMIFFESENAYYDFIELV